MFYLFRPLHSIYKARPDFRTFSHQFSIWAPHITLYAFREFIRKHMKPCFLRHNFLQQGGWDSFNKTFIQVSELCLVQSACPGMEVKDLKAGLTFVL